MQVNSNSCNIFRWLLADDFLAKLEIEIAHKQSLCIPSLFSWTVPYNKGAQNFTAVDVSFFSLLDPDLKLWIIDHKVILVLRQNLYLPFLIDKMT